MARQYLSVKLGRSEDDIYVGQLRRRIIFLDRHGLMVRMRLSQPVPQDDGTVKRLYRRFVTAGSMAVQLDGYGSAYTTIPEMMKRLDVHGAREKVLRQKRSVKRVERARQNFVEGST